MRLTNTLVSWAVMSHSSSLPTTRFRWLVRGCCGAVFGMTVALSTVCSFALLVGWPDLVPLTLRPVLGIGCLFGLLTGVLYAGPTEMD